MLRQIHRKFSGQVPREKHRVSIYENQRGLFLGHTIFPDSERSGSFDIYIYLVRHKQDDFKDVGKAEFFFGHMWGNRIFLEENRGALIGISTSAYGSFLCTCKITMTDGKEIMLDRYIEVQG